MSLILSGSDGLSDVDGSASTPAIRGTDSNTGIYFPGADRIGFSEGGTQVGEFDASGNFQFNSGYGSVATAYGCRAWVNFNGTGTVAIRASGNVTSITDNGVGDYTVNFTNAMPDANYGATIGGGSQTAGQSRLFMENHDNVLRSTTQLRIYSILGNASGVADSAVICVSVFR